jgi:hypothetical protein
MIAKDAWWDSEDAPFLAKAIHTGFGYEGTDEYQPLGSSRYELPGTNANGEWIATMPTPPIRQYDSSGPDAETTAPVTFRIQRWTSAHHSFSVQANAPATLALRLLAYPGWQVQVDGKNATITTVANTGEMLLALPARSHEVNIDFRATWDRIAGALTSVIFAITFLLFVLLTRLSRPKDPQFKPA